VAAHERLVGAVMMLMIAPRTMHMLIGRFHGRWMLYFLAATLSSSILPFRLKPRVCVLPPTMLELKVL
jgi:hypothetical protein